MSPSGIGAVTGPLSAEELERAFKRVPEIVSGGREEMRQCSLYLVAVLPGLLATIAARDEEIAQLRALARECYEQWQEAFFQLDDYFKDKHGHDDFAKRIEQDSTLAWLRVVPA